MRYSTMVVGLDVHKKSIVAAVLPAGSEFVTERATIENSPAAVTKLVRRIAARGGAELSPNMPRGMFNEAHIQ